MVTNQSFDLFLSINSVFIQLLYYSLKYEQDQTSIPAIQAPEIYYHKEIKESSSVEQIRYTAYKRRMCIYIWIYD